MLSESARATTAAEARFRVVYPNSLARRIKVIALDQPAERVVRRLARGAWHSATFLTTAKDQSHPATDWLADLARQVLDLLDQVSGADAVVTISTAGENAEDVAIIGEVCHARRI